MAHLHCLVTPGASRLPRECPPSLEDVSTELRKWSRHKPWQPVRPDSRPWAPTLTFKPSPERGPTSNQVRSDLSSLGVRLGFRCADLLCSDGPCAQHALALCAARLNASATADARRQLCERWLDALPKHLHPLCDALGGRCLTPQEAYPGATLWPSLGCAHERRALCAGPQQRSPCQPCVVKNGG